MHKSTELDQTPDAEGGLARLSGKKSLAPGHWRIKLLISYDGTDYAGWQRQTNAVSVQGTLEAALKKFYGKPVNLMGASRTDTGVHALGQVAHFDAPRSPTQGDLRYALNSLTPPSIVVKQAWIAPSDFHAIASSDKKTYHYRILNRRVPSALRHRYTYWLRSSLDLSYLQTASEYLLGRHDFRSFQTTGTKVKSTIREILDVHWERRGLGEEIVEFRITGNGFLKQMVRNIVGTIVDLHLNTASPERVREILEACDRRKAGPTAPPQGLYLSTVSYPHELDNKCRKL